MSMAHRPGDRPLSPHLQIYRLPLLALMSISHRITGVGLMVGTLLLTWWVVAAAIGPDAFAAANGFIDSWFGRLLLFGWTFALMYHLLNGIRHLVWDTGRALEIEAAERAGYAVIGGAVLLTVAIWVVGYLAKGAF